MAIVKNNYVKQNGREKANIKATIRYIQNRPGQDKAKTSRTLFGWDGLMERKDAYRMIDETEKGSVFWRFIISPDPATEDKMRDLQMREITEKTMSSLETHIKREVQWVAAIHADHSPNRHVHIVAVLPGRISREAFTALPSALRDAATEACAEQRRTRDLLLEKQTREREADEWEREY